MTTKTRTQLRPTEIHDTRTGETSTIRCSYRVCREHDEPVMLHVGHDGKIWIGFGIDPDSFSFIARVGDRMSDGFSRNEVCRAANCS